MSKEIHDKLKSMMAAATYITEEQAAEEGWSTVHQVAWHSFSYHKLGLPNADIPNEEQLAAAVEAVMGVKAETPESTESTEGTGAPAPTPSADTQTTETGDTKSESTEPTESSDTTPDSTED